MDIQNIIMADVFELELHDIHEDDPNRAPDSDDDIIEVDEVILNSVTFFMRQICQYLLLSNGILSIEMSAE